MDELRAVFMQRANNAQALFYISLNSGGQVVALARGQEEDAEDSVSTTCFDRESTSYRLHLQLLLSVLRLRGQIVHKKNPR